MTNRRALELMCIEFACVRRAIGMEYDLVKKGYSETGKCCDRNCESCVLVQDSKELLEMYDYMIKKMTEEMKEEQTSQELRSWQRECENGPLQQLAI